MNLEQELRTIVDATEAQMSVSLLHLESGEAVQIDADVSYPMCSVLKIPVLCEAFRQIHNGAFSLDDRWELTLGEKNLPSGVLVFLQDGLMPTVRDLLLR
ncbi:MAG: serine hydrolase [Caldilineaceae bacterium]|nr:serine hydrolase [Caldilineaceae bacterium]